MKKKITITVCDICKEEYPDNANEDDDKMAVCDLCKKDVCSGCSLAIDSLGKDIIVCESCLKEDRANKVIKKFFKQKHIKEHMIVIRDQLKEHLIKVAMLHSLSNNEEDN